MSEKKKESFIAEFIDVSQLDEHSKAQILIEALALYSEFSWQNGRHQIRW